MLSQKEYVDNNGSICPKCKSDDIIAFEEIEDCGKSAFRNCKCGSCGFLWEDKYDLVGYTHKEG